MLSLLTSSLPRLYHSYHSARTRVAYRRYVSAIIKIRLALTDLC